MACVAGLRVPVVEVAIAEVQIPGVLGTVLGRWPAVLLLAVNDGADPIISQETAHPVCLDIPVPAYAILCNTAFFHAVFCLPMPSISSMRAAKRPFPCTHRLSPAILTNTFSVSNWL